MAGDGSSEMGYPFNIRVVTCRYQTSSSHEGAAVYSVVIANWHHTDTASHRCVQPPGCEPVD